MNLSQHSSHPIFDIETEIVKAGNQPPPIDLKAWQERINKIVGKTVTGLPRLRVVWAQDEAKASMIVCGRRRLKYPFWRVDDGGEICDVGVPRFVVEELHTNSELKKAGRWDAARHYWDESTCALIDILGPIPEAGFYTQVFTVAYHDDLCCGGREVVRGEPCLGAYRPPTDSDVKRIRRIKYRRDTASNDERAPSDALIAKRTDDAMVARDERWRSRIRESIDDFMRTHSWKFTEFDPTKLAFGKFHFLNAHNKSGIKTNAISSDTASAA